MAEVKVSELKFGCSYCDWARTIHLMDASEEEEKELGEALLARHFKTHGLDFDQMRSETIQHPQHES